MLREGGAEEDGRTTEAEPQGNLCGQGVVLYLDLPDSWH